MIGLCRRYVPDPQEAEDLAHEAFLSAIEKSHTFKGIGDFDGWMMRITVNTALGIKAGSKGWFGNVEFGTGYKGFINAGVGYEF